MKMRKLVLLAAVGAVASSGAFGGSADFSAYEHKAYITFSGYEGTTALTNFPALVRISENLAGFSYADCKQADGGDVRFTLGDGNELPSACVGWNEDGASEFWVRIPELTATTRILMFWGNAQPPPRTGSVWTEDYSGVWQMNDVGKLILDSGRKGVHGFATSDANGDIGVAGKARTFADPAYAYLGGYDYSPLSGLPMTMEVWFKLPAAPGDDRAVMSFHATDTTNYYYTRGATFFVDKYCKMHFGESIQKNKWDIDLAASAAGELNTWHHAFASQDASGKVVFCVDGVKQGEGTFTGEWYAPSSHPAFNLGRSAYKFKTAYVGSLDEMRVSSVARSEDYAAAVYKNAAQNDQFLTIKAEPAATVHLTADSVFRDRAGEGVRYVADGDERVYADGVAVESVPAGAKQVVTVRPVKRQYRLSVAAEGGLAVTPATELWLDEGTTQTVEAVATGTDRLFYAWGGDCPTALVFTASIALPMDRPRTLTARAGKAWYVEKTGVDEEGAGRSPATPMATPRYAVETIRAGAETNTPAVLMMGDGVWTVSVPPSQPGNSLEVDCALVIRSRNGWAKTALNANLQQKTRCIYLNHFGACVDGLAVTNLDTNVTGWGLGITVEKGHVQNCLLGFSKLGYQCSSLDLRRGWVRRTVITGNRNKNCNTHAAPVTMVGGLMEDCAVTNNAIYAGAVRLGGLGGVDKTPYTYNYGGILRNTLIAGNTTAHATADNGAGLYCDIALAIGSGELSTVYSVENCTIADNVAKTYGGGAYATNKGGLVLVNCAFGGNSVLQADNGMDLYGPMGVAGSVARDAPDGNGNFRGEENFADSAHGDYSLAEAGFGYDIGVPLAWHAVPGAADLGGAARVQGKAVDAGAYEHAPRSKEPLSAVFNAAGETTGYDSLTVAFTSTVKGSDDVTYAWTFGDGGTSDEANPSHVYAHPGYYDVQLVVTDRASGESYTNAVAGLVKVRSSTVYVAEPGASVPAEPYDSPANAADNLVAALFLEPNRIVLCAGNIKLGNVDVVTLTKKTEFVGLGPDVTIVDFSTGWLDLNVSGSILCNVTVSNSRSQAKYNTYASVNAKPGTVVSNCVFSGTSGNGNREFNCALRVNGATVRDCVFRGLTHNYMRHSPCIEIEGGGSLVENCVITNNTGCNAYWFGPTYAQGEDVSGIGIRVAGNYAVAPVIRNCLVADNKLPDPEPGSYAAGIALFGRARLENCTIAGNEASNLFGGAGLHIAAADVVVENCIVWGNTGKSNEVTCASDIYVADGKEPQFVNSCAPELEGVLTCLASDPRLNLGTRKSRPFWSILGNSPCKDAGVRRAWMDGATDLVGNQRVLCKPDMGCYENQTGGFSLIVR